MASKLGQAFGKLLRGVRRITVPSKGVPGVPPPAPKPPKNPPSKQSQQSKQSKPARARRPSAPATDSTLVGATIEYNPDLDGDADPGEIVWTWVPWEEDPTQGKDRPVVIVGRRSGMLIGVPLTSKRRSDELQVSVGTGPWDREGRPSYAKLDRILEIDPTQVRREGSILARSYFDQIVTVLRSRPR